MALLAVIGFLAAPASKPPSSSNTNATNSVVEEKGTEENEKGTDTNGQTASVMEIMQARCVQCHAAQPAQAGFASAPAGIALETEQQVLANPALIKQVVASGYMPLANMTKMTDEERDFIANWTP
ncbi:MAG TPA: hypothetical protein DIS96_05530 [Pusillimonas sp.]|nr:hypothetical protein [Pusillimonas sp.]